MKNKAVRFGAASAALCAAAAFAGSPAQPFTAAETLATSNRRLVDPEFNHAKGLFTWVDMIDGSIWVGGIDKRTGEMLPESGEQQLIEQGAAPLGGLGFTLNGPEWALGLDGDAIVYTRTSKTHPGDPYGAEIGASFQNKAGKWVVRTLSKGSALNAPFGSQVGTDATARITYNDAAGRHFWRELRDPDSEQPIPGLRAGLTPAVRHVQAPGDRRIVYPAPVRGLQQVLWYDPDLRSAEQITDDAGDKEQPWIWQAPDFGDRLLLGTIVDQATVAVYEQVELHGGRSVWRKRLELSSPVPGARFFSLEPFVYGGRSYALMMLIVDDYPTSIWLAGFDPADTFLRRLTPELPDVARADPEVFFTERGPIVFFSRFDHTKGSNWLCVPCAEGLFRAETGIPLVSAR